MPLRFEVFLAVHRQYFLNPVWLATGEEQQAFDAPIDWGILASIAIPRRWLFTEAYDRALERYCKDRNRLANVLAGRIIESVSRLIDLAKEHRNVSVTGEIAFRMKERLKALDAFLESFSGLQLTVTSLKSRTAGVKIRTLDELRAVLRVKTSEKGDMARLARALSVPQARVSEWLSGKKEPGGKTTLRLLQWVEQPESKQNPGAPPRPGQKTRVGKSKAYEKGQYNAQKR